MLVKTCDVGNEIEAFVMLKARCELLIVRVVEAGAARASSARNSAKGGIYFNTVRDIKSCGGAKLKYIYEITAVFGVLAKISSGMQAHKELYIFLTS